MHFVKKIKFNKLMQVSESYTFNVTTTLRDDPPYFIDWIEGPSNEQHFLHHLLDIVYKELDRGDWIILDNCRIHKTKLTPHIIEEFNEAGIIYCLLPKYSPELNPPEKVFAKTKGILKRSTYRARYTNLLDAILASYEHITVSDMISFYKFSNYF